MPRNNRSNRRTARFVEGVTEGESYNYDAREGHDRHRTKGGRIERHRRKDFDRGRLQNVLEEDIDMSGQVASREQGQRYSPYGSGRGRHVQGRNIKERLSGYSSGKSSRPEWSKVILPHGAKYGKDHILQVLLGAAQHPFIPIYYHIEGKSTVFYVEDIKAADALRALDRQLSLPDGFKLQILVKFSPPPNLPISPELKEKIKVVMSRRYDLMSKTLSLSNFQADEELRLDFYCPLSRDNIMQCVVQTIGDNIPDVQIIDLSHNKLFSLDQLRPLVTKTPDLKALDLSYNKLSTINTLDRLQDLKLEMLALHRNPLCDKFKDHSEYISAVRKRFPKVVKLDGVELPPVISFDVGAEDMRLPASKQSCFINDGARQVALLFLEQYFAIYDADDRQPLINAYHDAAVFSLTASYPGGQAAGSSARLSPYMSDNRNLKRVDDSQRRFKLLHQGKIDVVSFISKLPATEHDPKSILVDVSVASEHLMVISVTGLFRERGERNPPVRWFQRVFTIVPQNGGYCITNEQLHVSTATNEQSRAAFKDSTAVGAAQPVATIPDVAAAAVPALPAVHDPAVQQQMIEAFSLQSGMNAEWSRLCLQQNEWDFEKSAVVFTEMNKIGQIPPEAFVK